MQLVTTAVALPTAVLAYPDKTQACVTHLPHTVLHFRPNRKSCIFCSASLLKTGIGGVEFWSLNTGEKPGTECSVLVEEVSTRACFMYNIVSKNVGRSERPSFFSSRGCPVRARLVLTPWNASRTTARIPPSPQQCSRVRT